MQEAGFLDKSELRKFERFLETFRKDTESFKRRVAAASAAADALAEAALEAFNDRNDKGELAARDSIQKIEKELNAAKDKLTSSLRELPDTLSKKESDAFKKVQNVFIESCDRINATFPQYFRDMNDRGRLAYIDVKKAAVLLEPQIWVVHKGYMPERYLTSDRSEIGTRTLDLSIPSVPTSIALIPLESPLSPASKLVLESVARQSWYRGYGARDCLWLKFRAFCPDVSGYRDRGGPCFTEICTRTSMFIFDMKIKYVALMVSFSIAFSNCKVRCPQAS